MSEIYWGAQTEDMERYQTLAERLKIANFLQEAASSDFGQVRLGIRLKEGIVETRKEPQEAASKEQLRQIQDLFGQYWQNPGLSELAYQKDKSWGYTEFGYPYGQGGGSYPPDYGKVIIVRLSRSKGKREILVRDAYDQDTGIEVTSYLRVEWDEKEKWKIDRGRHSRTIDAYFLQPEESKPTLSKQDTETVLLVFKLLSQPKQKRR